MPAPVSDTRNCTYWPGTPAKSSACWPSRQTMSVEIVSRPPPGIASRAFTATLTSTCFDLPGIGHDRCQCLAPDVERDVLADGAAQELFDVADDVVEIHA